VTSLKYFRLICAIFADFNKLFILDELVISLISWLLKFVIQFGLDCGTHVHNFLIYCGKYLTSTKITTWLLEFKCFTHKKTWCKHIKIIARRLILKLRNYPSIHSRQFSTKEGQSIGLSLHFRKIFITIFTLITFEVVL
jgi:hypothetical protein